MTIASLDPRPTAGELDRSSEPLLTSLTKFPVTEPEIGPEEELLVLDCLRSGWISSAGKYIDQFESQFAHYCNRRFGIATANGTVALHLALLASRIGPGDEVLVPALTFVACVNAVLYVGAKPVFVDVDRARWGIDVEDAKKKYTAKTKAIMVVHLYGRPANVNELLPWAEKKGLVVIEDAAEAHGVKVDQKLAGSFGHISVFSFFGNKVITTGEGGMLLVDEPEIAANVRKLRDHNMDADRRYFHPGIGYNYRMTNIQAAIGIAQLKKLERFVAKKRQIARWYREALADCKGIELIDELPGTRSIFWLYSILLEKGTDREKLREKLKSVGVDSRPFFVPLNELPFTGGDLHDCPVAHELSERGLSLPSSTRLDRADVHEICSVFKELLPK